MDKTSPEMHGIAAMYKSFMTDMTIDTMEVLRRSCGGHGFLAGAGFSTILSNVQASCTYDGDNTVLALQTVKSILKMKSLGEMRGKYSILQEKPVLATERDLRTRQSQALALVAFEAFDNLYRKFESLG